MLTQDALVIESKYADVAHSKFFERVERVLIPYYRQIYPEELAKGPGGIDAGLAIAMAVSFEINRAARALGIQLEDDAHAINSRPS